MDIRSQVNQARGLFNFRWALPCPLSISATLSLSWLLPSSIQQVPSDQGTYPALFLFFYLYKKTMLSHYFLIQIEIAINLNNAFGLRP